MESIKISLKINDYSKEYVGKIDNDTIYFNDLDTKYSFDLHNLIFIKEDKESYLTLDFNDKSNKSSYLLKELDKKFNINLVIKELKIDKNVVIIRYEIEKEVFSFLLVFEKGE